MAEWWRPGTAGECVAAAVVVAPVHPERCETFAAMDDQAFMTEALAQGRAALGRTGDNPAVGCVVVCEGRIVGRGATQPPGSWHAEVMAVRQAEAAGHDLSRCEVYITLEPCTFTGRTPPCAELLIAKHPRRVVIGIRDPHPKVRGRGVALLREAGIEVAEGVLADELRQHFATWLARHDTPPPPA